MDMSDHIGRRIKLHDLRILMAVVQAGSMNKAAALLNTSQPAISRSIAELETAVGVCLLDRKRQGIEPTSYGRALLECGAAIFDELRQGMQNIAFLADPTAGEVRIGSDTPIAASFVSAVIDRLSRRYPRLVFHLVATQSEMLRRELTDRNVDLLVTRRWGLIEERFDFEFLFNDSFVVVAGAQSPWARRRTITLAELVNEPWALPPPESLIGSVATEAFRASGLEYPRATVFTTTAEVRMGLLATGRLLTILATSILKFSTRRRELKILPVELPITSVPNGIFTLKDRTLGPVAQLFIEHAREVAKPLAKKKS